MYLSKLLMLTFEDNFSASKIKLDDNFSFLFLSFSAKYLTSLISLSLSLTNTSDAGVTSKLEITFVLLCVSMLKYDIVSISSPKNSSLIGLGDLGGKISNIPPLTEN